MRKFGDEEVMLLLKNPAYQFRRLFGKPGIAHRPEPMVL
jgi:hypothetical protein